MKRFFALTKAMFLIHIRECFSLFWNFGFPIFLLVIDGAIFSGDDVAGFMTWMLPGVVAINILAFGLISSSTMMVEMRRKGVLRRLQASPVPTAQLIGAYLLVNVAICTPASAAGHHLRCACLPHGHFGAWHGPSLGNDCDFGDHECGTRSSRQRDCAQHRGCGGDLRFFALYFGQMFISDTIMPVTMMPAWVQQVSPWLPGYAIAQLVRPPYKTDS